VTVEERRAQRQRYLSQWARSERNRRYYLRHRDEILARRAEKLDKPLARH
jgi:hypothetical protein